MTVKIVWITPGAEKHIAYCARVSSPENQRNEEFEKLLKYLIRHRHWSPFEMACMCVEIKTSRAISAQILRHRSFSFQEFSQRYAETSTTEIYRARRQDNKNRQNSIDDLPYLDMTWFRFAQDKINAVATGLYKEALSKGIAKECARFLMPMSSSTTLYMSGSIRSWIHYLNLRTEEGTQLEHREIAEQIKSIIIEQLPTISKALDYTTGEN